MSPTKPPPWNADPFTPGTRDDVTDLALLPGRFDTFAREVRTSFDLLATRLLPTLERIEATIANMKHRQDDQHAAIGDIHTRLENLEKSQRFLRDRAKPLPRATAIPRKKR